MKTERKGKTKKFKRESENFFLLIEGVLSFFLSGIASQFDETISCTKRKKKVRKSFRVKKKKVRKKTNCEQRNQKLGECNSTLSSRYANVS
jgi:hypothetical protein